MIEITYYSPPDISQPRYAWSLAWYNDYHVSKDRTLVYNVIDVCKILNSGSYSGIDDVVFCKELLG